MNISNVPFYPPKDGQMGEQWVKRNIDRLLEKAEWNRWGNILNNALRAGKLRGIAVKTPYSNKAAGEFGDPYIMKTPWTY